MFQKRIVVTPRTDFHPRDFNKIFQSFRLRFSKIAERQVFDLWRAEGIKAGLKLPVELYAYPEGFLDTDLKLINIEAATNNVYTAVVCRWQMDITIRAVNYDRLFADDIKRVCVSQKQRVLSRYTCTVLS